MMYQYSRAMLRMYTLTDLSNLSIRRQNPVTIAGAHTGQGMRLTHSARQALLTASFLRCERPERQA